MTDWTDPKQCLEAVKQDGYALGYVKDETREICLEAIKQNIDVKEFIRIPLTDEHIYETVTESI